MRVTRLGKSGLMCDLIALGFQTDKTRVATLLMCRDISGLSAYDL